MCWYQTKHVYPTHQHHQGIATGVSGGSTFKVTGSARPNDHALAWGNTRDWVMWEYFPNFRWPWTSQLPPPPAGWSDLCANACVNWHGGVRAAVTDSHLLSSQQYFGHAAGHGRALLVSATFRWSAEFSGMWGWRLDNCDEMVDSWGELGFYVVQGNTMWELKTWMKWAWGWTRVWELEQRKRTFPALTVPATDIDADMNEDELEISLSTPGQHLE